MAVSVNRTVVTLEFASKSVSSEKSKNYAKRQVRKGYYDCKRLRMGLVGTLVDASRANLLDSCIPTLKRELFCYAFGKT